MCPDIVIRLSQILLQMHRCYGRGNHRKWRRDTNLAHFLKLVKGKYADATRLAAIAVVLLRLFADIVCTCTLYLILIFRIIDLARSSKVTPTALCRYTACVGSILIVNKIDYN